MRIVELLHNGLIEIGLVRFAIDTDSHETIQLPPEPLVAAIHKDILAHFPDSTDTVELCDLAEQPLMIHRKYEAMLTDHCQHAGFTPYMLCKSDDIMPLLAWADAGVGIAIVPRAAIGLIPSVNLTFRTIVKPQIETTAAVIWMRNRYLSPAARHFLNLFVTMNECS